MKQKSGDFVEVFTKKEKLKGRLMPSKDKKIILKLNSGYNISIDEKNIRSIKNLTQNSNKKEKIIVRQNKSLPKLFILHTGGTIASKVNYETGAVSSLFTPEELLEKYPELKELAYIESKLIFNELSDKFRISITKFNLIIFYRPFGN